MAKAAGMEKRFEHVRGTHFWISPEGQFHKVGDGEHEEFAADEICPTAAEKAREDYPKWEVEDTGDQEEYRGAVFSGAYELGWADAHVDRGNQTLWIRNRELRELPRTAQEVLKDFAVERGLAIGSDWWKGREAKMAFDARPPAPSLPAESLVVAYPNAETALSDLKHR